MTASLTESQCSRCPNTARYLRRGLCNNCYQRDRRAGRIDGLVPATKARRKIVALVDVCGWNYREIARAAGIDRTLIAHIVDGRKKINVDTSTAICAIKPADRDKYRVTDRHYERTDTDALRLEREALAEQARRASQEHDMSLQAELAQTREEREARGNDGWAGAWEQLFSPAFDTDDEQEPWQERGLCNQTDPEIFFPEKGGSTREAKAVCQGCPVRDECLEYALANEERFGIWGGLSERERRRIIHERRGRPVRKGRGWIYQDETNDDEEGQIA